MTTLYNTAIDPLLSIAYALAGTAGEQAAKAGLVLGAFVGACEAAEALFMGALKFIF